MARPKPVSSAQRPQIRRRLMKLARQPLLVGASYITDGIEKQPAHRGGPSADNAWPDGRRCPQTGRGAVPPRRVEPPFLQSAEPARRGVVRRGAARRSVDSGPLTKSHKRVLL